MTESCECGSEETGETETLSTVFHSFGLCW